MLVQVLWIGSEGITLLGVTRSIAIVIYVHSLSHALSLTTQCYGLFLVGERSEPWGGGWKTSYVSYVLHVHNPGVPGIFYGFDNVRLGKQASGRWIS